VSDALSPLVPEFPEAGRAQWIALVEKTLNGASFEQRLVRRSYAGLDIQPL